jgi:hypothetical protein
MRQESKDECSSYFRLALCVQAYGLEWLQPQHRNARVLQAALLTDELSSSALDVIFSLNAYGTLLHQLLSESSQPITAFNDLLGALRQNATRGAVPAAVACIALTGMLNR